MSMYQIIMITLAVLILLVYSIMIVRQWVVNRRRMKLCRHRYERAMAQIARERERDTRRWSPQ